MARRLLSCLLLLPWLAAAAWGDEGAVSFRSAIELEQRLLAEDLSRLSDAREQERAALAGAAAAAESFDAAVRQPEVGAAQLRPLLRDLAVAEAVVTVTQQQVTAVRTTLEERLRRLEALRQELQKVALGEPGSVADPVSGRWRVEIANPRETGHFVLKLVGSEVTGTYELAGGGHGSLRGTYVQGRLRLERIDAEAGLDGVLEGTVDARLGTTKGFWSPSRLSTGGPGGSGWSGVRLTAEAAPPREDEEP